MANNGRIFVAGPMFSRADRDGQKRIVTRLRGAGFDTYLAQADGFEMLRLIRAMQDPSLQSQLLYEASVMVQKIGWSLEIYEVFRCDGLVLNMNGRVPDEGAVMEATLAYGCGKPVVNYKDSSITMWGLFDNPMVASLDHDWQPIRQLSKLPKALEDEIARVQSSPAYACNPPPFLVKAKELGKYVSDNSTQLRDELLRLAQSSNIQAALAALAPDLRPTPDLDDVRTFLEHLLARTVAVPAARPPSRDWPVWPPLAD